MVILAKLAICFYIKAVFMQSSSEISSH